tara:strand:- start:239 stop:430 length:192 start_codon:yes stop_codon:yes gene_type:complete
MLTLLKSLANALLVQSLQHLTSVATNFFYLLVSLGSLQSLGPVQVLPTLRFGKIWFIQVLHIE